MGTRKKETHQYFYAYEVLPGAFRNDKDRFFEFLEDDGVEFLRFWWDHAGEKYDEAERMEFSDTVAYEIRILETGAKMALITLPVPKHHGEAYFLALIQPSPKPAFFPWQNLGKIYSLSYLNKEEKQGTVLGEWTPRGRYFEIERNTPVDLETFFQKITAIKK